MKDPDEKLGVWIVNKSFYGLGFGERELGKSRCRLSLPGDLILITSIEADHYHPTTKTRERVNFVWDTGVVDFVWNYFNNGEFHLFGCLIRPPRTE